MALSAIACNDQIAGLLIKPLYAHTLPLIVVVLNLEKQCKSLYWTSPQHFSDVIYYDRLAHLNTEKGSIVSFISHAFDCIVDRLCRKHFHVRTAKKSLFTLLS